MRSRCIFPRYVCVSCSVVSDSLWSHDCSPPGFSVHGILQTRILEWVVISFTRGSSQPRDWTQVSCMQADSLQSGPPGKPPVYECLIDPADLLKRHFHFLLWILVPFCCKSEDHIYVFLFLDSLFGFICIPLSVLHGLNCQSNILLYVPQGGLKYSRSSTF